MFPIANVHQKNITVHDVPPSKDKGKTHMLESEEEVRWRSTSRIMFGSYQRKTTTCRTKSSIDGSLFSLITIEVASFGSLVSNCPLCGWRSTARSCGCSGRSHVGTAQPAQNVVVLATETILPTGRITRWCGVTLGKPKNKHAENK